MSKPEKKSGKWDVFFAEPEVAKSSELDILNCASSSEDDPDDGFFDCSWDVVEALLLTTNHGQAHLGYYTDFTLLVFRLYFIDFTL